MQVSAGEFEAGRGGVDLRGRHGPDRRLSRPFPPDHDRPCRGRGFQAVGVFAKSPPGFVMGHSPATDEGVQAGGQIFRNMPTSGIIRQPPEREKGKVTCGHDIHVVPRPPELD